VPTTEGAGPVPTETPATPAVSAPSRGDIEWEISVPLLSNRAVVGGMIRVFGISVLLIAALMTVIFGSQGEWDALPPLLFGFLAVFAGLVFVSLLVMALVFRNRMRFRYTVSDTGVLFETIDKTVRAVDRIAVVGGILGGSAQATGAGLIAQSQETQELRWEGAFRAEYRPRSRVVILRNAWRQLMLVYCTPENYAEVAARIGGAMEASGTAERVPGRSPIGRYVAWSAVAVLACLPLFALADAFDVPLLLPIGILCFALATIWFVGLFGYVVIAGVAATAWSVAADGLGTQASFFSPGETFARWTVYSGDDWALIAVAGAGCAVLCWLSYRAVTGRMPSMLASDAADMMG
jgi:hypothetical protein